MTWDAVTVTCGGQALAGPVTYLVLTAMLALTGYVDSEFGPQPQYALEEWAVEMETTDTRAPLPGITPAPGNVLLIDIQARDETGGDSRECP